MKKKRIAFWRHDQYPFILHGEITKESSIGGQVETKEYGKGYWFKPEFILEGKKAQRVIERLDFLKEMCEDCLKITHAAFHDKLTYLIIMEELKDWR